MIANNYHNTYQDIQAGGYPWTLDELVSRARKEPKTSKVMHVIKCGYCGKSALRPYPNAKFCSPAYYDKSVIARKVARKKAEKKNDK